jgi:copper oxidase (laccase) domain-containing protein
MRALGDEPQSAHLGPCIRPGCYEFGELELRHMTERFGPSVAAATSSGRPALDVPAAVGVSLREQGVAALDDSGACTACGDGWFSHRARGDSGRFVTVAWLEQG